MAMKASVMTMNGRIVSETRNGVRHFHAHDQLGNTIALYDDSGTKTDSYTYWPYGEVRTRTGTTVNPFQFCGAWGYYKDSSGRTYVRARTLRTDLTRWISTDPLWPAEAAYHYCDASPIACQDQSGCVPCDPALYLLFQSACQMTQARACGWIDCSQYKGYCSCSGEVDYEAETTCLLTSTDPLVTGSFSTPCDFKPPKFACNLKVNYGPRCPKGQSCNKYAGTCKAAMGLLIESYSYSVSGLVGSTAFKCRQVMRIKKLKLDYYRCQPKKIKGVTS